MQFKEGLDSLEVTKDASEPRYTLKTDGRHWSVPWLVRYSAQLVNIYQKRTGGTTAYDRTKGTICRKRIHDLWLDSLRKDRFNSSWGGGMYVGFKDESNEMMIGADRGIGKAKTSRRLGFEKERWSIEEINKMKGSPWEPVPGS